MAQSSSPRTAPSPPSPPGQPSQTAQPSSAAQPPPQPSHGPLHQHVLGELRRRIVSGTYAIGDSLPSESSLCAEFSISRGTARQALGTLRSEGLIGGGQGRPPVVRSRAVPQPFETFLSFSRWAVGVGRVPGQRTVEVARRGVHGVAADALGLEEGTPVVEVLRLRLLDGVPAMVERDTFIEPVGRLIFEFDPDTGSIYDHLISRGADLHAARHVIDAVAADETDADLLEVPAGAPLLRERRTTRNAAGVPVEYADDRYLPELAAFTIDNTQDTSLAMVRFPTASAAAASLVSPTAGRAGTAPVSDLTDVATITDPNQEPSA
ncbi:GntR family transcriptional regulator [Oerskovia sp. NPDC056781]|uniref:GntR family transcriptional regulator n=1 Tax=Oerskovia sp. NPDC056781 TaxID=3345942 RepID=UPI00367104E4